MATPCPYEGRTPYVHEGVERIRVWKGGTSALPDEWEEEWIPLPVQ